MKKTRLIVRASSTLCALFFVCSSVKAQTNSWIGSSSGDWESPQWSSGLPQPGETIFITNAGSKTIVIEPTTAQNNPQSLYIQALTISSPGNSANTLLMNNAGLDAPLIVGETNGETAVFELTDTNCTFEMNNSSLIVNNSANFATSDYDGAFYVAGKFNESAASSLICRSIYVGKQGPAIFNLTDSAFTANGAEYVGGFPSVFNQNGGTNNCIQLTVTSRGEYDLYSGDIIGMINPVGGTFNQWGGTVSGGTFWGAPLAITSGSYHLYGGILNSGDLTIPILYGGSLNQMYQGGMAQSGGTNYCNSLTLGGLNEGTGVYVLSGGSLFCNHLNVDVYQNSGVSPFAWPCSFTQTGGYHTNGSITISGGINTEGYVGSESIEGSTYNLQGGILETPSITTRLGGFNQSGGTNNVGTFTGNYNLSGGILFAQNVSGYFYYDGTNFYSQFNQSGGTNSIGTLSGNYTISGGLLAASNILVTDGYCFQHSGGKCSASLVTFDGGIWQELTNDLVLGQLQLGATTNSMIQFPSNACILQFADSSELTWSNTGVLTIVGWKGSTNGGGKTVISVGTNANGLTALQLAQIQFANPAGFAPGYYVAQILGNGELVPGDISYLNAAPARFFTGEAALGSEWYYLNVSNQVFGYYSLEHFPFVYHADMGWEYFVDAGDAAHGAYFYDCTDNTWIYTQPTLFPYLYDFNQNAWLYYLPNGTDRYTSNPRWFYNFATQTWLNHL